jgi:hypothetical protein
VESLCGRKADNGFFVALFVGYVIVRLLL